MSLASKLAALQNNQKQKFIIPGYIPVVEATYRKSDQMVPLLPGKLEINLGKDFGLKPHSPPCQRHNERNKFNNKEVEVLIFRQFLLLIGLIHNL